MPSAAMLPWPMAVVSRCGRMTSPPQNMPWLRPAGHLILGGIIDTWADAVLAALARNGFTVATRLDEGDWVGLVAQHLVEH